MTPALTSIAPGEHRIERTSYCLKSWRKAGLEIYSFNHPSELNWLERHYSGVTFVSVGKTTEAIFGGPYVPINAFTDWISSQNCQALIINADIELRLKPSELVRICRLSAGGLCYFIRYNHRGPRPANKEAWGIDAFLLGQNAARLFSPCFLSMGQPYWDYWLPYVAQQHRLRMRSVEFPAAFHLEHKRVWTWDNWHKCAREFYRTLDITPMDGSFDGCRRHSSDIRRGFDETVYPVDAQPPPIRELVTKLLGNGGQKIICELGSHDGTDTDWLSDLPGAMVVAVEPDPRNQQQPKANVTVENAAIADRNGVGKLYLSQSGWGRNDWTYSSSIKRPKNHLTRYPVTFDGEADVQLLSLDTLAAKHGITAIELIWADIQGAEGEMIAGGRETLKKTRYLYTEYSDDEMYDGQISLSEILKMLPSYRIIELWPDNVLLENTEHQKPDEMRTLHEATNGR